MNENTEQLTETFAAHEHLAPDAVEVMIRAKQIARSYQRRRWAVRATGGAVLGAGLVAGGIVLPGRLGHAGTNDLVAISPLAGGGEPASTAPATAYTQDEEWAAYFAAGYDYNDAQRLAQLWNDTGSIGQVKAEAGQLLLEGQTLPFAPTGTPEDPTEKAQSAFFAAGYDYDDAVTLGNMWHDTDITQVKTDAGQKLLEGQTLPIPPSGPSTSTGTSDGSAVAPAAPTKQDSEVQAFFAAGYTYDDAVTLGNMWHESDTYQVKADAGQKLLDGKTLPIAP